MAPSSPNAIEIIGKYRVGQLIGSGGFAKVYHGFTEGYKDNVAIKIINKSNLDSSKAHRISSEISAMRRLNHPNIIRIHDVLETKSEIYLVMELAIGGDLCDELLRRPDRRMPERMALRYFHQIVSALHFCHRHGIVHCDIKPENILLDADDNAKLSDFGLCAITSGGDLLLKTACGGTPAYTAPEMAETERDGSGGSYDGAKADAWSCGVLLYTMVVGECPFADTNGAKRRELGFPSHVTGSVRGVIYKLLDRTPKTRLSIEEITNSAWFTSIQFGPKSMSLGDLVSLNENKLEKMRFERVSSMNAFDIIGMNSGLELSGFTSESEEVEVEERVVEVGGKLGYEVEKRKGGKKNIWLRRQVGRCCWFLAQCVR